METNVVSCKKVFFRVSPEALKLMEKFRLENNIKSMYELNQRIIACFVRFLELENNKQEPDDEDAYLNDEVQRMFNEMEDAEEHFEFVKPKQNRFTCKTVYDV